MPEVVFRRMAISRFGNWVQHKNEQQLQAISDEDLLVVFEYDMVVRHPPGGGVVFQGLLSLSAVSLSGN